LPGGSTPQPNPRAEEEVVQPALVQRDE